MREKLTEKFCTNAEKAGYYADGGGLYLIVKPDGRKYWCFRWRDRHARYTTGKSAGVGKLREKGLGRFSQHDISLLEARKLAGECRQLLRQEPVREGLEIGFDVQLNDRDADGVKQWMFWSSYQTLCFRNPSSFGRMVLGK